MTIEILKRLRESEDKVEFKEAKRNYPFAGGSHSDPEERRKCLLGYIVAFANEKGGKLVLGMTNDFPHQVVGTDFAQGKIGALEDEIYNRLQIRIHINELLEGVLRVLVFNIPSRPLGRMLKFEGAPLMRVGDSLRIMSDEEMFAILQEQEPDFSAKICHGLTIADLNSDALDTMRLAYIKKQRNQAFQTLPIKQMLRDLNLLADSGLTYAALVLLGNQEAIVRFLPQAKVIWEFRFHDHQIPYDFREEVCGPLFIVIDHIWKLINDKNATKQLPVNAYIFSTLTFNETVIREALLNAVAHRDYTVNSEVVIHQYPHRLTITNPGGFPKGVDQQNLITSSSTPRSRLMTEIMEKTGLVERSGQGIDKIYSITLAEGKSEPNYKDSTIFQVVLKLNGAVQDQAFSLFIQDVQNSRTDADKLGVLEIMALYRVKEGQFALIKPELLKKLELHQLITRTTNSTRYSLASAYASLTNGNRIGNRYLATELELLLPIFRPEGLKIGDLETALSASLNRNQIKFLLSKLQEDEIILAEGKGKGTRYKLAAPFDTSDATTLTGRVAAKLRELYPIEEIESIG